MPATIFKLFDLLSFSVWIELGINGNVVIPVSDRVYLHHNSMLREAQLVTFMILYNSVIKESKPWIPLQTVVEQLKKEFNKSSQVFICRFAFVTPCQRVMTVAMAR
ncbi:hypothetical protein BDF20DRAFT_902275 [Mycotypha africana]|uniref:uncharacterized protein n=1 Tax=Mycotypha africana TaxID=64632 RepID=UPI0023017444|nr:uncharacterized protein BDF20DRAFT_902275 [Mycotypha africana]KAI8967196.1 hypothetical protein BDF20DRAFT_902275 [Mycotypha africana]